MNDDSEGKVPAGNRLFLLNGASHSWEFGVQQGARKHRIRRKMADLRPYDKPQADIALAEVLFPAWLETKQWSVLSAATGFERATITFLASWGFDFGSGLNVRACGWHNVRLPCLA
jgi:hypothetical protein